MLLPLPVSLLVYLLPYVKSNIDCSRASIKTNGLKLIDDCDLVNDDLLLGLPKITTSPHCVTHVTLSFESFDPPLTVATDGQRSVTVPNPVVGANRCVSMAISATVRFVSKLGYWDQRLEMRVDPLAEKCLNSAEIEFKRKTSLVAVNLSQGISKQLWDTCIYSVSSIETREPGKTEASEGFAKV